MATTVCALALLAGASSALAAPAYDAQGYLDSTARCASAEQTVVFGSTDASRVAICETPGGTLQYRGVRVRDGGKLVVPASRTDDGTFVADNGGATYTVSPSSLVVRVGTVVLRTETMVDFHALKGSGNAPAAPSESSESPAEPESAPEPTTTEPTATESVPDGPPLPAEVGGSAS